MLENENTQKMDIFRLAKKNIDAYAVGASDLPKAFFDVSTNSISPRDM